MQLVARSTCALWALAGLVGCAQGAAVAANDLTQATDAALVGVDSAADDAGGGPTPGSGENPGGDSGPGPDTNTGGGNPPDPGFDAGGTENDAGGEPDAGATDAGPVGMTTPDAAPPAPDPCAEICTSDLVPDAKTCNTAVTIGRKAALADDFLFNGDTRGDGNNQDLTFINCGDGNADNFFRIFLYKDDVITMRLATAEYDPVLTLTQGVCTAPEAAACRDLGLDGESELLRVSIVEDGWHHVVADGPYGSTAPEGQGRYTLSVSVDNSLSKGTCNCP